MKILVTISSEQIWPQIIPFYVVKPDKIVILHTVNLEKSKKPAERLADFLKGENLIPSPENIILKEIREIDYPGVLDAEIRDSDEIFVNLTGGLKTMSIMLHSWAESKNARELYCSERNKIQWFSYNGGVFALESEENIPAEAMLEINAIDPIKIAKLYHGAERINDGNLAQNNNDIYNIFKDQKSKKAGDVLERELMFAISEMYEKLGIHNYKIRHSVKLELKNKESYEEIDILINYNCSLILIEAKMRKKIKNLDNYMQMMRNCYSGQKPRNNKVVAEFKKRLSSDISDNQTLQYKSDLFSAGILGGLKKRVIWVSINEPSPHEKLFCEENNIECVRASLGVNFILDKGSKERLFAAIKNCR